MKSLYQTMTLDGRLVLALISVLSVAGPVAAQDTLKKKTIEITSSFKPTLRRQDKFGFTASALAADSVRRVQPYQVPEQQLRFALEPPTMRHQEFMADTGLKVPGKSLYVKAGMGNFSTPLVRALASFGDGTRLNGNVEGHFTASKGSMPFQQFSRYGASGNMWVHFPPRQVLHVFGGFLTNSNQRYGFNPAATTLPADSIRLRFTDVFAGAGLGNRIANASGITYEVQLKAHFFTDSRGGSEPALKFFAPVTKSISDKASVTVAVQGLISSFKGDNIQIANNLFLIPVSGKVQFGNKLGLVAGLVPSWNGGAFNLMPNVELEYRMNDRNQVLQAGVRGYYVEQTYRDLTRFNPWVLQPKALSHTRTTEWFGALKMNASENLSFRLKAGAGKQFQVPLFVNSGKDGRNFEPVLEQELSRIFVSAESDYRKGERFLWNNTLKINHYSGLASGGKPYGLVPVEFQSSLQVLVAKGLRVKADLYQFNGIWHRELTGASVKGKSVFDVNAGMEFDVLKQVRLWVQFHNMLNQTYERWNQYPVLGFQALGGIIVRL